MHITFIIYIFFTDFRLNTFSETCIRAGLFTRKLQPQGCSNKSIALSMMAGLYEKKKKKRAQPTASIFVLGKYQ